MNAEKANDTIDAARQLQRALYRAAKASATRRFHTLYDKVYRQDILFRAWQEVKARAGAAGVDGQSIEAIEQRGVEGFLTKLADDLREGDYRPQPVRRVFIPKADGKQRPLGIPTVRDRVVQASAKVVPEPIFEADFRGSSYGFRPKRNAHQAMERVRQAVNAGWNWAVDADIQAFFDRIDHAKLVRLLGRRISDRRMLKLVRQWLEAGVLNEGEWLPSEQGVPQGGVISPLLANIVLHELDRQWEDEWRHLGQLVRYADDFVILCGNEGNAQKALRCVEGILAELGLTLHPEKTRLVDLRDGKAGFDFLGFHCRKTESWRYRRKWYLRYWPSHRSMQRVRDCIKAITAPRHRLPEPVQSIVAELNPLLSGWGAYFRVGSSGHQFGRIDDYVRERLALFLRKKVGRKGRHWRGAYSITFQRLGLYRLSGTVAWHKARPTATR